MIAQNGSVIWSRDSQLLYVREISHETAAQLADVMKEKKLSASERPVWKRRVFYMTMGRISAIRKEKTCG